MARFRLLSFLALCGLLLALCAPARADTAIRLYKSFNGSVNFTGTQVTLRNSSNSSNACSVASSSANRKADLVVPAGATILSAQLYWAGSGPADNTVTFQGKSISAERKYTSATAGNGMNYFSGVADVTDYVKGSGTYTFSGLTVANGNPWCASQAVLGGFSLLVVYAHPSEPERVLNLYEGFRYVQNGEISFTANNFRWPRPWWPVVEKARIGHITWEGDATLAGGGERLIFDGKEMTDDMNPAGNQFNSRSNINRDYNSYGIDFDAYDTEVVQWILFAPSVTTIYRTGQDLVLLSAEILVVPTLPVSDLSIQMTRGGAMQVGQRATYTMVVTNNGPYTEAGPITVTNTLPAGMSYVSGSGVNWTCGASGQLVTCTYKPALAPNLSAPALTITASIDQSGKMLNTARVDGTSDNNEANDTASDEATALAPPVVSGTGYVFTDRACAPKVAYPSSACLPYSATVNGGSAATIYVTAVRDKMTVALSGTEEKTVSMQFGLACQDPASAPPTGAVKATYAGATLPFCMSNGSVPSAGTPWSPAVSMKFPANQASVAANFVYADVGTVQLYLLANGNVSPSVTFTSVPKQLEFRSIVSAGGMANPGAVDYAGGGFVAAGNAFYGVVGARLFDGSFAPNFGRETGNPDGVAVALSVPPVENVEQVAGALTQTRTSAVGGVGVTMQYSEVGVVVLTPGLSSYLATGRQIGGLRQNVGRFFPAYYRTSIETTPFGCADAMRCDPGLSGAAYSRQPFEVTVEAYNAEDNELKNFKGKWRQAVKLVAAAGQGGAALPAAAGSLAPGTLAPGAGADAFIRGTAEFELPVGYGPDDLAGKRYTDPTAVYLRASSTETLASGTVEVSSRRTNPEDSVEAGIMIVNGRLNVPGAQGVNTLPTPLRLQAQYWNGNAWLNHAEAPAEAFMPLDAVYSSCGGALVRAGLAPAPVGNTGLDNCNTALVRAASNDAITLAGGAGVFRLAPPGAGAGGSVWVRMRRPGMVKDGKERDWLPSTRGRVHFGAGRSPLIYLREVY